MTSQKSLVDSKERRNAQIYREKLDGRKVQDIASRYFISISRVVQICDRQRELRRLRLAEHAAAYERSEFRDWRELPVRYAQLSVRLRNILLNEQFKTMGEVSDDWAGGGFRKRLPIPNCGPASLEELEIWILAHTGQQSLEVGLVNLKILGTSRLNESLSQIRNKIEALRLIERRILAKLDGVDIAQDCLSG